MEVYCSWFAASALPAILHASVEEPVVEVHSMWEHEDFAKP